MTEETKNSKTVQNASTSIQEKKAGIILDIIKAIMNNTWGMRISLGVLGVLLFFIGYIIGNWGTSHLESEIRSRESDVKQCKAQQKDLKISLEKSEQERNALRAKLSESKEKINFIKQREKIRKPLNTALYSWKNKDAKDTVEKVYAALINLKSESRNSIGLSKYFYTTTIKRLNLVITLINTKCASEENKNTEKSPLPTDNDWSPECINRITGILSSALDILPPPKD